MKTFISVIFFANLISITPPTKTQFLTNGTSATWYITSTPSCESQRDDKWIFYANGIFEYDHGSIVEDNKEGCSDMVNAVGTWNFSNKETTLRVNTAYEKENPANKIAAVVLNATIVSLNQSELVLKVKSKGKDVFIKFTKK
jgi:hypothetical protein